MYSGFLPIGMIIFGPLADVVSLQWIMIGSGIGLVLIAVITKMKHQFTDVAVEGKNESAC